MKKIISFGTLLVLLGMLSCSSSDDGTTPDPITSSDIRGFVNLYDELTTQIANNGMKVTVEGTDPEKSALTDTDGEYTITDVPFGTYTLAYSKSGYGTFKRFEVGHSNPVDTNISDSPILGQASTTEVIDLGVSISGDEVVFDITIDPTANSNNPRYIRLFYHNEATVSNMVFTSFTETLEVKINPIQYTVTASDLSSLGFQSGTTVYVKVYGNSFFGNDYDDPDLGRRIFPNLNATAAEAVSFVVP